MKETNTKKDGERKPRKGATWLNLISGQRYKWDGKRWVGTGEFPFGKDPMGLVDDGVSK